MILRPYQTTAIDCAWQWMRHNTGNPAIVIPTGGGKSPVMGAMARQVAEAGGRVGIVAHIAELVSQNHDKLRAIWPEARAGIYAASMRRRDRFEPILFMQIQSVAKRAAQLGRFDLLLVDEAHRVPLKGDGLYLQFIAECRRWNPDLRVVGLTATPYRLQGAAVPVCGPDNVLQAIAYEARIGDLIEQGYLSKLVSRAGSARADLTGVHTRGGEYIEAELARAVDRTELVEAACDEIVAHAKDRKALIVFAVTVAHAEHVCAALKARGVATGIVHGAQATGERNATIDQFQRGKLRALVNVNVLSEGFDAPHIDCVAMLRPTKSPGLYYQQVGRGLRLAPGKADCIAEGQRVLTDCGLVPIEHVTTEMKIWDGVDFVSHCGTVLRGQREVIEYAGLEATADHLVWTKEGWKAFGKCAIEQTPIAVTGNGGAAVWQSAGCFRRDREKDEGRKASLVDRVHRLLGSLAQGLFQLDSSASRMPRLRQPAISAKMAGYAGNSRKATLHQFQRSCIRPLRRAWDSFQIRVTNRNGCMGTREPWTAQGFRTGPDQQRWSLRAWKPALFNALAKLVEHAEATYQRFVSSVSTGVSCRSLCGFDTEPHAWVRDVFRGNSRQVQQEVCKTKRRVWDILNCGPRNRFTVEGLLVHNCLILDFAGNTLEHGPVDAIRVSAPRKPGQAGEVQTGAAKECPQCQAVIAAGLGMCPECGHEFPARKVDHFAAPVGAAILSSEQVIARWHDVGRVTYAEHVGKSGTPTLQVTYWCGLLTFSEWVCLEHTGMARAKAVTWWRKRETSSMPCTIGDAMAFVEFLKKPTRILVSEANKYPEITNHDFDPATEAKPDQGAATCYPDTGDHPDSHPVRGMRRVLGGLLQPTRSERAA